MLVSKKTLCARPECDGEWTRKEFIDELPYLVKYNCNKCNYQKTTVLKAGVATGYTEYVKDGKRVKFTD